MAAKMRRWVCPTCGDGCLAPGRPRRDDVRRYCLDCSKKTGRLVERVAPAVQRSKEQRLVAEKERAEWERADRERQKVERTQKYPGDLLAIFEEWKRLPIWGQRSGLMGMKLIIKPRVRTVDQSTARWQWWGAKSLEFMAGRSPADAVDQLLYLMAYRVRGRYDAKQRALHHAAAEAIVGHAIDGKSTTTLSALAVWLDNRERADL